MRIIAALLGGAILAIPAMAQNETDWKVYFAHEGVTFYWSPSSLQRNGDTRTVKWHDTRNPQVVFKVRIDCKARTIQSLSADEYDLNTGDYYQTEDLSGTPVDMLGTPVSMGGRLEKTVC